ncbi:MAG: SMP-30/gluconolactonase/LRE family protein, partial [Sphingobium sp.]
MLIRKVGTVRCTVGEGPLWDAETGSLYFVDLVGQKLWHLDPANEDFRSFAMPGFAITATHDRTGRLLVVLADGLYALDTQNGSLTLVTRPDLPAGTQLNDAKVDRQGRIVALGADAALKDPIASSYSFDFDGNVRALDHGFAIGNGPCWSPDGATFYSADSVAKVIYAYDYDTATGAVANRRLFADTADLGGIPDGATVDTRGNIWMAMCGA